MALFIVGCGKETNKIPLLGTEDNIDSVQPNNGYYAKDLFEAVDRNDIDLMNLVLANGVDINSVHNNESLLSYAIKKGRNYEKVTLEVIKKGIDLNIPDAKGESVLTLSFKANYSSVALAILAGDIVISNAQELFIMAIDKNNFSLIEKLIEKKPIQLASITQLNLYQRIIESYLIDEINITRLLNLMESFHTLGADINKMTSLGNTLLTTANQHKLRDVAIYLLSKGVDINQQDSEGKTALIWSVIMQDADAVNFLMDRGADKKIKDASKKRACSYANGIEHKDTKKEIKKRLKCWPYIF